MSNPQYLAGIKELLLGTLSPNNAIRANAEKNLETVRKEPNFEILLLEIISGLLGSQDNESRGIILSATVLFKNIVKAAWKPVDGPSRISDQNKTLIKTHLVDLMCRASPDVQKLLSESVTLVAEHDFPDNWMNLFPQLLEKLASQDLLITRGVLLTVNSICKRFRFVSKSDELYMVLVHCLKYFQEPLLLVYKSNGEIIKKMNTDVEVLKVALESQRLMTRIFFSLAWQDLPEYFEDHLSDWMNLFLEFLSYQNALMISQDECEPGPVDKLHSAIIENLNLFASKYEEEFSTYLGGFSQIVWELLMHIGSEPKFDSLASSAIKFLSTISSKKANDALFSPEVLKNIIDHIVVKNLTVTQNDEEMFEDNPFDYVRKDMENSDQDSRRRCATDLMKGLMKFHSNNVTVLAKEYIAGMLTQYNSTSDWRLKDSALHLVLAASLQSSSSITGNIQVNPEMNIIEIFQNHVLPEIHDANVNSRPIIKADAIKMICLFRTQFPLSFIMELLPHIIRHLNSKYVVIQTYAALCIQRFLEVKDKDVSNNTSVCRVRREHLESLVNPLFTGLFFILESNTVDNEYVLKCVMKLLYVLDQAILPITRLVLDKLGMILARVCKNPANPHFNHYLFECICLLIRSNCHVHKNDANALNASCEHFEEILLPAFQHILSTDIDEFLPYVFQILGQLLGSRHPSFGLPMFYRQLLPTLVVPKVWERKGNVPALVDLLRAYLKVGVADVINMGQLLPILGVFQKLLSLKSSETYSFLLLHTILAHVNKEEFLPVASQVFNLLLVKLKSYMSSSEKQFSSRFSNQLLHTTCFVVIRYGSGVAVEILESITPGLVTNLFCDVWQKSIDSCSSFEPRDMKEILTGLSLLLQERMIHENLNLFVVIVNMALKLCSFISGQSSALDEDDDEPLLRDEGLESREFDSVYSKLIYASFVDSVPIAEVEGALAFFANQLGGLCKTHSQLINVIKSGSVSSEHLNILQTLFHNNNIGTL